jgi:hypothetical protein
MFYLDLFKCLHEHKVRYLLAGGLAMNLHGVPRMTMDVDLLLALDDTNIDGFIECARELGLKPQAPVALEGLKDPEQRRSWVEQKRLIAFALSGGDASAPTVDIILKHDLDFDAASARAVLRDVQGVPVSVASIEDMIILKQNTGRRQDKDDVEHLLRIKGAPS